MIHINHTEALTTTQRYKFCQKHLFVCEYSETIILSPVSEVPKNLTAGGAGGRWRCPRRQLCYLTIKLQLTGSLGHNFSPPTILLPVHDATGLSLATDSASHPVQHGSVLASTPASQSSFPRLTTSPQSHSSPFDRGDFANERSVLRFIFECLMTYTLTSRIWQHQHS